MENLIPKTVFKYANAEKQSLINLKNQVLYMSPPKSFNDPYDCSINLKTNDLSEDEVMKLRDHYILSDNVPEAIKRQIKEKSRRELAKIIRQSVEKAINNRKEEFLNKNGVCCFSETKDSLLMWAHYANSFRGFCLEFYTNKEPFSKIRKVSYSKDIPQFDFVSFVFDNNNEQLLNLFLTKAVEWEYESEWRLLHAEAGTEYSYESELLKSIYFGPRMDFSIKEIICLILQNQNANVEIWDGSLVEDKYSVEFKRVNYIPYLEAKRLGIKK